jgi:hypothetical protein
VTVDDFLARLERVKRNGEGWIARRPAHEDRNPSLSIREGAEGILVHCFAGCSTEAVVDALGLTLADLFEDRERRPERPAQQIVATYDYVDEGGARLFQVVRFEGKRFLQRRPDGADGWIWKLDDVRRVLYFLPDVRAAIARGATIYVVEGERDVHRLEDEGVLATTNPGGAGKWRADYTTQILGAGDAGRCPGFSADSSAFKSRLGASCLSPGSQHPEAARGAVEHTAAGDPPPPSAVSPSLAVNAPPRVLAQTPWPRS